MFDAPKADIFDFFREELAKDPGVDKPKLAQIDEVFELIRKYMTTNPPAQVQHNMDMYGSIGIRFQRGELYPLHKVVPGVVMNDDSVPVIGSRNPGGMVPAHAIPVTGR